MPINCDIRQYWSSGTTNNHIWSIVDFLKSRAFSRPQQSIGQWWGWIFTRGWGYISKVIPKKKVKIKIMIRFENSFLSLRFDFFFCGGPASVPYNNLLVWRQKSFKKEPKNLLKNQLEFVSYNFTRKKSFTNEVTYHLSSPEFPPLEVDDDPTFPVIVSVWWLLLPLPTLPTTPPPLLSPATPLVL